MGRRRWGHSVSMPERYYKTTEGIKNKQLGWDPICDLSNPLKLEQGAKLWSNACNLCHVGCKTPYLRRNPPLAPTIGELRHDNGGGWNANVMIPGYDVQSYLSTYVDTLGLDSEDVSGVVAWMMECYDRGLVTQGGPRRNRVDVGKSRSDLPASQENRLSGRNRRQAGRGAQICARPDQGRRRESMR